MGDAAYGQALADLKERIEEQQAALEVLQAMVGSAYKAAVQMEREACAAIAEQWTDYSYDGIATDIANRIRARNIRSPTPEELEDARRHWSKNHA